LQTLCRFCYVDDQWNRYPTQQYDTCRPLASEKWGTYKCGELMLAVYITTYNIYSMLLQAIYII